MSIFLFLQGIELIVDVSLRQSEDLKFVPIAEQFPEIFKISKSASTIKPKMEPGSRIDIAEGTFDSDKKLCLDVGLSFNIYILEDFYTCIAKRLNVTLHVCLMTPSP